MVSMLHRKLHVNDGFNILKVVISRLQTRNMENRQKIEDVELQALLDKDDSHLQKQLVEQLGVSQQAIFNRLREMKKIQKTDRWVSREFNDRQMEKR